MIKTWLTSSLVRNFPLGAPRGRKAHVLYAARGERVSFQVCVLNGKDRPCEVSVDARSVLPLTVRRVGCVPVPHHNTGVPEPEMDGVGHIPGFVPDPLFPESNGTAAPREITSFWVTVDVPRACRGGAKGIMVAIKVDGKKKAHLAATVKVSRVVLAPRRNFRVTHWFYADALCDWYGVEPFGKDFWPLCERYMKNYAAHGCDTIYVPVFTPPLDGVKRPTQLLRVNRISGDAYSFDWRDVTRWIRLAKKCGIKYFEWTHFFTQWGCARAIRIYEKRNGDDRLLWPPSVTATSRTYRAFLSCFLPALKRFLEKEKLLNKSFFHVSDEPHGGDHLANYRKARCMLKELAPWMKVMDALSEIRFGREKITDMPISSIRTTKQFLDEGIPCWTYFCCGPRGKFLNRLLDTPLAKIRMAGWLFYRFGVKGFLHWGYNYWYPRQTRQIIDPFRVTDGLAWPGWAYGDTSVVYPGAEGPIDSIRWEVFAESLQDYRLLQTLSVDRRGLSELKDFDDFPKDGRWIDAFRKRMLFPAK